MVKIGGGGFSVQVSLIPQNLFSTSIMSWTGRLGAVSPSDAKKNWPTFKFASACVCSVCERTRTSFAWKKMVAERSNKRQAECSVFPPRPAEIFGPIREISMYIFSSMHNMMEWQSRRSQSQYYN